MRTICGGSEQWIIATGHPPLRWVVAASLFVYVLRKPPPCPRDRAATYYRNGEWPSTRLPPLLYIDRISFSPAGLYNCRSHNREHDHACTTNQKITYVALVVASRSRSGIPESYIAGPSESARMPFAGLGTGLDMNGSSGNHRVRSILDRRRRCYLRTCEALRNQVAAFLVAVLGSELAAESDIGVDSGLDCG